MADTEIEWCHKVWNFVRGCRRVSPGCGGAQGQGGCYAEKTAYRFSGPGQPYEGLVALGKHGPHWTGKGRFVPEKLAEPLHWRAPRDGSRLRIFVNSMSDLFFEEFSNEEIAAGFGVMAACPQHDFLILTKRPKRAAEWFRQLSELAAGVPDGDGENRICLAMADRHMKRARHVVYQPWPLPNVWIGVSAENQETADERIPILLSAPAAVRFVSAEPLLGPIDLRDYFCPHASVYGGCWIDGARYCGDGCNCDCHRSRPDWIIVGGESGNGSRPFDVEWARQIVDQCKAAGVSCFVKQVGALWYDSKLKRGARGSVVVPVDSDWEWAKKRDKKGGDPSEWPEEIRVRQFPGAASLLNNNHNG